jgi:hypothetical protein
MEEKFFFCEKDSLLGLIPIGRGGLLRETPKEPDDHRSVIAKIS